MKLPLNLAIIKYFTTVKEACADDVIDALKADYGDFKMLNRKAIYESLFTAEINGFLKETRYELASGGNLKVYYHAPPGGKETINKYIPD